MILPIVMYGHPALRQKGARIESLTPEIEELIRDLRETMYEAHGVGLAAQQVGRALQVAIVDVTAVTDRPSTLEWDGAEVEVSRFMPLVLINPQIRPLGEIANGPEGCLSFPEIYGDIPRPASIEVTAQNEHGRTVTFRCGGLLARAIQHEADHLNGILFIDRMEPEDRQRWRGELEVLQAGTKQSLKQRQHAPS